ncbi:MAG: PAS domain S-box protein, partial [Verrucomicrobiales bacterium]|nr:PAS domain S-box protein [Verrucomicrobiales bacterium]
MSARVPLRALILEDSEFDARVMVQALRAGGYDVRSSRVETGEAMDSALKSDAWDIVLADYNMPEFNATQALRILQSAGLDIPFIIVSGGIGEDVAVAAMKAGAHDYVMKGSPARLLPAVDRELREAEMRRKRREAEALLRESELRYRSLWETSPDAVLFCDEAGAVGFANPAAETVFGLEASSFAGRPVASLEPASGGGLSLALAEAGRDGGRAVGRAPVEGPGLRSDGREILLEVASSRLDLPDRRWYVLFARDITEKRRNEIELRAREEQMRAAREIQQRLFPKESPKVPGYDIAGTSVPADATGGDYYDFLPMTDGLWGLVVADVSGHGLGPSLLMM